MIEKLDVIKHTENLFDKNGFITNVACGGVIISKVNELIDAVNSIIGVQEKVDRQQICKGWFSEVAINRPPYQQPMSYMVYKTATGQPEQKD